MEKYRIVSESYNNDIKKTTYHIEKKGMFVWKPIMVTENSSSVKLSFDTYEEAEKHMTTNYFRDGDVYKPRTNEYHYKHRTYNFY